MQPLSQPGRAFYSGPALSKRPTGATAHACIGNFKECQPSRHDHAGFKHNTAVAAMNAATLLSHNCDYLGTSALGMVSATVALVTVLRRCMMRRLLVSPTSLQRSPRPRAGCDSRLAAHTLERASAGRAAGEYDTRAKLCRGCRKRTIPGISAGCAPNERLTSHVPMVTVLRSTCEQPQKTAAHVRQAIWGRAGTHCVHGSGRCAGLTEPRCPGCKEHTHL